MEREWSLLAILAIYIITTAAGQDCFDSTGRRYGRGQTWQIDCNTYQCEFDGARIIQRGCLKADNSCFNQGETYQYHCFTYRCDVENDRAVRREVYAGCTKADGSCYGIGERYKYFCYEYVCSQRSGLPRREMITQACSYFERCIPTGQTIQHGRRQYRCAERPDGQLVWDKVQSEFPGCYTDDGTLVPESGTRREECTVLKCYRTGTDTFALQMESTGCKDVRGECVPVGSQRFACYLDGRYQSSCICRSNNGGQAILDAAAATRSEVSREVSSESLIAVDRCKSPTSGAPMAIGAVIVHECVEYICEAGIISDEPQIRVLRRDCRAADGRCVRPGLVNTFPCMLDGKRSEKCTCTVDKDGQLVYNSMPESCRAEDGALVSIGNRHMIECVTYLCRDDGTLSKIAQGCKGADGRCKRLGSDNFACIIDGRLEKKCKCMLGVDGNVEYLVDMMSPLSCKAEDGSMIEENKVYTKACVDYRCVRKDDKFELVPIRTECQTLDGQCIPVGSSDFTCLLNNERALCQCHVNDDGKLIYSEYVPQTGCLTSTGKLLMEGEKEEINCAYHICRKEGKVFKLAPHSVECSTADGHCVSPGSRGFACVLEGRRHDFCECHLNQSTGHIDYVPLQHHCTTKHGDSIPIGETTRIDCVDYICERSTDVDIPHFTLQSIACKGFDGNCYQDGDTGIPCLIEGEKLGRCKCEGDGLKVIKEIESPVIPTELTTITEAATTETPTTEAPSIEVDTTETATTEDVTTEATTSSPTTTEEASTEAATTTDADTAETTTTEVALDAITTESATIGAEILGDVTTVSDTAEGHPDITTRTPFSEDSVTTESPSTAVPVATETSPLTTSVNEPEPTSSAGDLSGLDGSWGSGDADEGCLTTNGEKIAIGDLVTENCIKYICGEEDGFIQLIIKEQECQGLAGRCHKVGETEYECAIEEETHARCQCFQEGDRNAVNKPMLPVGCVHSTDGDLVLPGQVVQINCTQYLCTSIESGFTLTPQETECMDSFGSCHELKTGRFPCHIDGSEYKHCRCEFDDVTGLVTYSALPNQCKTQYGNLVDVNTKLTVDCTEFACKELDDKLVLEVVNVECRNSKGECLPIGSENFACIINGAEYVNCKCSRADSGDIVYSARTLEGVEGCTTSAGEVLASGQSAVVDCITYECVEENKGQFLLRPSQVDCKTADGLCQPVGSVGFPCDIRGSRYNRCRCDLNGEGQLFYSALATECTTFDDKKVQIGETFTHFCTEYKCIEQGSGLVVEPINRECRTNDGLCVPVGTPKFPCEINGLLTPYCTCKHDERTGDMIYYKNGCEFRGEFMLSGEIRSYDCIEYQCNLDGEEWVVSPNKVECMTADKECVPVGSEKFPCLDNAGIRFDNCRCDLDASQKVVYSLRQSSCPVDNFKERSVFETTIDVGQTVTSDCVTYICQEAENNGLELVVTQLECKTNTGQCKPLGSKGFPCQLGDHCQCKQDGDGIVYSQYGCMMGTHHMYPDDYREENCTEYVCKEVDDGYQVEVNQQIGCPGNDDTCYPAGSAPFQCKIDGTVHDTCLCEKNSEGRLAYKIITQEPTELTEPTEPIEPMEPTEEPTEPTEEPTEPTEEPIIETEPTIETTTTEDEPKAQASDRKAGTKSGGEAQCYFPFMYDGEEQHDCVTSGDDYSRPWCAITANYPDDDAIGYCFPKEPRETRDGDACAFPFSYSGVQYYDCIAAWTGAWCATTADYDNDGKYGKCK